MHAWSHPEPPAPRLSRLRGPLPAWWLLGLVTVLALCTPKELGFGMLMAAAPVLAAALTGPRRTAEVAAGTLAAATLVDVVDGRAGAACGVLDLALVAVALASLLGCVIRRRREHELRQARSVSAAAQRALLHPLPRRVGGAGGVELSGTYLAAAADARIGGDVYEALDTPWGVRLLIGDIRGKGLPAVDASAALLGAFREAAYRQECLTGVAGWLEESMTRHAAHRTGGDPDGPDGPDDVGERFATALLVEVPRTEPVVRIAHCGHTEPLLLSGGRVSALEPRTPGPPIGLAGLAGYGPQVDVFPFREGDRLLLSTDGVTEARVPGGEFYPLPARAAQGPADESLSALVHRLRADLLRWTGGRLDDDAALLAVRRGDEFGCGGRDGEGTVGAWTSPSNAPASAGTA